MRTVLFSWLLTLLLSMRFLGNFLGRRVEGRVIESGEVTTVALVLASIGISLVLTLRRIGATPSKPEEGEPTAPGRRRFLGAAAASSVGVGASLAAAVWPNRAWTCLLYTSPSPRD